MPIILTPISFAALRLISTLLSRAAQIGHRRLVGRLPTAPTAPAAPTRAPDAARHAWLKVGAARPCRPWRWCITDNRSDTVLVHGSAPSVRRSEPFRRTYPS